VPALVPGILFTKWFKKRKKVATVAAVPLVNSNNAEEVFRSFRQQCVSVQSLCIACQAASVPSNLLASLLQQAINLAAFMTNVQGNATLLAAVNVYLENVTGQTTHNFLPDLSALLTNTQALVTAIVGDYPVDAIRHPLDRFLDVAGNVTFVNFTQAQLVLTAPAITVWLSSVN
jgi:hypothetical protein